jgi:MSHA biogenesis protein MshM
MYYDHFGLKQAPFKITPNTDFFFAGANRGAILDALIYAINNGEGVIKVVGEVGSGKTMLCRMLQARLPERVECVYLANPSVAPEDVVFAIAFELQLQLPANVERLQAMQMLQKYLLDQHAQGRQVVIFVEEAQGMPIATLEEIRLLTNLETKHDKLLQIVLFGQPELDTNLNTSQIRQLRERITHSFYLDPINQNTIREYLIFRLRSAGYFGPPIFTESAIKLIAKASQGLVRRVNILADKAMLATYAQNLYLVDVKQVEAAISDSEFGAEEFKRRTKRKMYLGILALLVVALLISWWVYEGFWQRLAYQIPVNSVAPSPVTAKTSRLGSIKLTDNAQKSRLLDHQEQVTPPMQTTRSETNTEEKSISVTAGQLSPPAAVVVNVNTGGVVDSKKQQAILQTAPVPAQELSGDLLQQRLEATELWLKQQPEDTVSIQLMGSSNEAQLTQHLNYLATHLNAEKIYAYRTQVNKKPFITILYGSFSSRREASAAIEQLPEDIKLNQPQIRTIGGVLKEINQIP